MIQFNPKVPVRQPGNSSHFSTNPRSPIRKAWRLTKVHCQSGIAIPFSSLAIWRLWLLDSPFSGCGGGGDESLVNGQFQACAGLGVFPKLDQRLAHLSFEQIEPSTCPVFVSTFLIPKASTISSRCGQKASFFFAF